MADLRKGLCSFCGNKKQVIPGANGCICKDCAEIAVTHFGAEIVKGASSSRTSISFSPVEMKKKLDEDIVGQEEAKKILSVAVCNHIKRMQVGNTFIKKANIMLVGPTGCGKTMLMSKIAEILDVPMVSVDATSFTKVGYVGQDATYALARLFMNANGDIEKAQKGIVYVDEIDKLAISSKDPRDPGGIGVQQNLLKLMEGGIQSFKIDPQTPDISIDTSNILFVFGGAFVGIEKKNETREMGFTASVKKDDESTAPSHDELVKYGLIPEFVGRIPVVVNMNELTRDDLMDIMCETKSSVVKQYEAMFKLDGIDVEFDPNLISEIIDTSMKKKTGARGLRGVMEKDIMNVMFEASKHKSLKKIKINRYLLDHPEAVEEQVVKTPVQKQTAATA